MMDRSYLSDQAVVRASRDFICLRLISYENEAEMEFLNSTVFIRGGPKNPVFAILDPTGTEHLVEAGRSMISAFDDAADMAARMQEMSADYPASKACIPARMGLPYLGACRE